MSTSSLHSMHLGSRSESFIRIKETSPVQDLGATGCENPFTVDARPSLHIQDNLGRMRAACSGKRSLRSLHRASVAQKPSESCPATIGTAPDARRERSLPERSPFGHLALEEQNRQLLEHVPPSPQLCFEIAQLRAAVHAVQLLVQKLVDQHDAKERKESFKNKLGAKGAHNTNDNNSNNRNNNKNSTNKTSQESSFNSLDLDNANPESDLSGSDLDTSSLGSFDSLGYAESSFSSQDQQEAACSLDNHHLGALGQQMMTIGVSLGSLTQNNAESSDSFDQEGQELGTWNQLRDNLGQQQPRKKKVTFSKEALAAYKAKQENDNNQNKGSHPGGLQLEQLRPNTQQQSSHNEPRRMQQQPAAASEKKLEHRPCKNYNLDSEEGTLGSLEQHASSTNLRADRCPKLNNNTCILGQDLKNTAAWGILVDTGAAVSLAPVSFAPTTELSPLRRTIELRTVTGKEIEAFGCKTVHLVGRELSLTISFVIASVEHVVLGLDVLLTNQLSIVMSNKGAIHLVNQAGAKIQLQNKGHLLYLDAWPMDSGFGTCNWSSFPQPMEASSMTRMELTKMQLCNMSLTTRSFRLQGEQMDPASPWKTLGSIRTQQL